MNQPQLKVKPLPDLVVEVKAGFQFISPPENIDQECARIGANAKIMQIAYRLIPQFREMIMDEIRKETGLYPELAKEGQ